jgi:hypothetical protein
MWGGDGEGFGEGLVPEKHWNNLDFGYNALKYSGKS